MSLCGCVNSFEVCGKTARRIPYEAPRGSEWGVFFHQRLGNSNPWWSIPFRTFSEAEAFWAELVESSKSDGSGRTHIIVNEYSKDGPDWLFEDKQRRDDEQTHWFVEGTWQADVRVERVPPSGLAPPEVLSGESMPWPTRVMSMQEIQEQYRRPGD